MSDNLETYTQPVLNKSSKDKFNLILTLPRIMQGINTTNHTDRSGDTVVLNSLQFSVFGTIVPSQSVPHKDVRFGGQAIKITGHSRNSQQNVNVGFVIDNRYKNYWVLWKWLQILNHELYSKFDKDDLYDPYKNKNWHSYMTDLEIQSMDEYNKVVAKFKYTNAFIVALDSIEYDHQNPDQILSKFEFGFGQMDMQLSDGF